MTYWSNENGEGSFQSKFFQDDEHKHRLSIYINDDKLKECAEKCVESFNNLTDGMIDEICTQLWENVKDEFTKCERKAPNFIYGDISSLKNNDSISLFFIVLYF